MVCVAPGGHKQAAVREGSQAEIKAVRWSEIRDKGSQAGGEGSKAGSQAVRQAGRQLGRQ